MFVNQLGPLWDRKEREGELERRDFAVISSPFGLRFENMESVRVWEVTQFASLAACRLLLPTKDNFQDSEWWPASAKAWGKFFRFRPRVSCLEVLRGRGGVFRPIFQSNIDRWWNRWSLVGLRLRTSRSCRNEHLL